MTERVTEVLARALRDIAGVWLVKPTRSQIAADESRARAFEAILREAGYAVVLREPTEKMIEAGSKASGDWPECTAASYRAMIEAGE